MGYKKWRKEMIGAAMQVDNLIGPMLLHNVLKNMRSALAAETDTNYREMTASLALTGMALILTACGMGEAATKIAKASITPRPSGTPTPDGNENLPDTPRPSDTVGPTEIPYGYGGEYSPAQWQEIERNPHFIEWKGVILAQNAEWVRSNQAPWGSDKKPSMEFIPADKNNLSGPGGVIFYIDGMKTTFTVPHPKWNDGKPYMGPIGIDENNNNIPEGQGPMAITKIGTIGEGSVYAGQKFELGFDAGRGDFVQMNVPEMDKALRVIGEKGQWEDIPKPETPTPFDAAIGIGYHQQYFTERGYTGVSSGVYEQGGIQYNAMYGEKNGERVLVGMEVGGKMRQASKYEHPNGFVGSVWFTPTTREEGNLLEGIVSLNPENAAAQIFESLIKAVAEQKGTQPENIEAGLLTGGGQMNIRVPEQNLEDNNGWWIHWPPDKTLSVDLTKPVELRASVGPETEPSLFAGLGEKDVLVGYSGQDLQAEKGSFWLNQSDGHLIVSAWKIASNDECKIYSGGIITENGKRFVINHLSSTLSVVDTIGNLNDLDEWKGYYNTLGNAISWRRTEDVFYVPITK